MSDLVEMHTSDEFRIWYYKRTLCARKEKHEWAACTFAHLAERANRRDPRTHGPTLCQELEKTGECPMGDACPNAHSVFEAWLHPLKYRTQLCSDGTNCTRHLCFFAHNSNELRTDTSIPACPPDYDQVISRAAPAASTLCQPSSTVRQSHYSSQGGLFNYQCSQSCHASGDRNAASRALASGPASGPASNSAPAAAIANRIPSDFSSNHCSSGPPPFTASHSASQQYYSSGPKLPGVQVRVSNSGNSCSSQQQQQQQQQHARSSVGGRAVSPSAASTPAAVQQQQPGPGMHTSTAMMHMPAPVSLLPFCTVPAGYASATTAAAYRPVYAPRGGSMPAIVCMSGPASMAPPSLEGSRTAAAHQGQSQQQQQQSLQHQGTGVYVPAGTGPKHMLRSQSKGSRTYGRSQQQQQQAPSSVYSRNNNSTSRRKEQRKAVDDQQQDNLAVRQREWQYQASGDAAVTEQVQSSSSGVNSVPPRQTSEEAAAAAAGLPALLTACIPEQQQQEQQTPHTVTQPQLVSNASILSSETIQQPEQQHTASLWLATSQIAAMAQATLPTANTMQQTGFMAMPAASAAATSTLLHESAEVKLVRLRDMLRVTLQQLSATSAQVKAAEARIAVAESYFTRSALQAYAAATVVAKAEARRAKREAAAAAAAAVDVSVATAQAAAADSATSDSIATASPRCTDGATEMVNAASDAGQLSATRPQATANRAPTVATLCANARRCEVADDKAVDAAPFNGDDDDEALVDDEEQVMQQLAELLPVSIIALAESQMLVLLPRTMTPADVGSLLRAAMTRAGANEVQVRTADVIIQAQLVAMRESQAEIKNLQTELNNARRTAQDTTGERDKLETKYTSYKTAAKQHLLDKQALQQALAKAQREVQEAQASAAAAWATVSQAQKKDVSNWADAVSDSDDEGLHERTNQKMSQN